MSQAIKKIGFFSFLIVLLSIGLNQNVQSQIIFGADETIFISDENLSSTEVFLDEEIKGLAIDTTNQLLFYTASAVGSDWELKKANLDGSGVETVLDGFKLDNLIGENDMSFRGIALDVENQQIYIADLLNKIDDFDGRIIRVDYAGENAEVVIQGEQDGMVNGTLDVALDNKNDRIYWVKIGAVMSANLDGSDITTVIDIPFYTVTDQDVQPTAIEIDTLNGKLYWADPFRDEINLANLDGSEEGDIIQTNRKPTSLHVDVQEGKLYWIEGSFSRGEIYRSDLDGNNIEKLIDTEGPDGGLVVQNINIATNNEHLANDVPNDIILRGNYPNPFNPSTVITFELNKATQISLSVFNSLGQKVSTLIDNELKTTGQHSITFGAFDLSSGIYYYTLQANNQSITKPMVLIK